MHQLKYPPFNLMNFSESSKNFEDDIRESQFKVYIDFNINKQNFG
jgi:hypothetical protein